MSYGIDSKDLTVGIKYLERSWVGIMIDTKGSFIRADSKIGKETMPVVAAPLPAAA
jgi:hypothetical protein